MGPGGLAGLGGGGGMGGLPGLGAGMPSNLGDLLKKK
jgi:signal recognition particle subunit SRP54